MSNLIRILNDKYTWIGYGDGISLEHLYDSVRMNGLADVQIFTKYDTEWNPLRRKIFIKPLDINRQWSIHISYGDLKQNDLDRLAESGDIDGLLDETIYSRNFQKIRVNTNPNLSEGDEIYQMMLDILSDYFDATHTTEIDIAMDYNVDFINNCTIVDQSPVAKPVMTFKSSVNGKLETLTLGDRNKYTSICCYNKKLERKVKSKPLIGFTPLDSEEMFRLECRFHGKESNLNFHNGKNPLEHILFVSNDISKIKLSELKGRYKEPLATNLYIYINNMGDAEELKNLFPPRTRTKYKNIVRELLIERGLFISPHEDYEKQKDQFIAESVSYLNKFSGRKLNRINLSK